MQENEPLSQTRLGLTPELGLTVSRQRICTCRARNGALGSEIGGAGGKRRHEGSLPRQGLLLITLWHSFRTVPEDAVMGSSRPGPRKEGGTCRIRDIPNIRASLFFPPHP